MWIRSAALIAATLTLSGCYQGYARANELESQKRGPADCAETCTELGMRMGALVLVERNTSGCVCEPVPAATQPAIAGNEKRGNASAVAAAHVVIEQAREQQQQQQQSQQAGSTQ